MVFPRLSGINQSLLPSGLMIDPNIFFNVVSNLSVFNSSVGGMWFPVTEPLESSVVIVWTWLPHAHYHWCEHDLNLSTQTTVMNQSHLGEPINVLESKWISNLYRYFSCDNIFAQKFSGMWKVISNLFCLFGEKLTDIY